MTDLRTLDYLIHIRDAGKNIAAFIQGSSKTQFKADIRTQKATVMCLIEIGEAATKILQSDPEFIEMNSNLPWRSMRGMRNRIAHGYFDVDLDIVWDTVETALPELTHAIENCIKSYQK
mgnify:CR=1 FL=1